MTDPIRYLPLLATLGLAGLAAPAHAQLFPVQTDPDLVRCESVSQREATCRIPAGKVATFAAQHSSSPCTAGQSYVIRRDTIVVSRGCRASFRLSDASATGTPAQTAAMRADLAQELAAKIRSDRHLGTTPSITLQSERQRPLGAGRIGYDGTARVTVSGAYWNTVEFSSVYDVGDRDIDELDYRVSGDVDVSDRRALLRSLVDSALEDRLEADFRNNRSSPRFELLTDAERAISSNETGFSGTGRIMVDGRTWQPVNFESVYDWRSRSFRSLSYRPDDGYGRGEAMDEDAEAALERAIAEEVRRQKGSGDVQVVINRRFRAVDGNGRITYSGKFGYSFNDGEWITRGYQATLNRAGQNVRDLRIFRLGN